HPVPGRWHRHAAECESFLAALAERVVGLAPEHGRAAESSRFRSGSGGDMPQWTLFENDFRSIDSVLSELLERTNALSVHLVDRSGQLITTAGRCDEFDATAFASLVAADFTANAELASLLGESGV